MGVRTKMGYRMPPNLRQSRGPDKEKMKDVTVEDLGDSKMEFRFGQRVTRVIPEGSFGNNRPFTTTEEVGVPKNSKSIVQVKRQVKRNDPRMGTTTMTEVRLGESDPKYFQIPAGRGRDFVSA
jgi:hypothetical protein